MVLSLLAVLVLAGGVFAIYTVRHRSAQIAASVGATRVSGIPSNISTPLANLMALSPVPNTQAPGFSLVNQFGQPMSLQSLRGRAVVLEFMDPHCTDICPIVAQEFVDAYHDLGKTASHVAFIAVNVNQFYRTPATMEAFTNAHGLNKIPSWQFGTGSTTTLQSIWRNYNIVVSAPNPNADIVHSSIVYFIGPNGKERYLASPFDDHTKSGRAFLPAAQISSWGQGIALLARDIVG